MNSRIIAGYAMIVTSLSEIISIVYSRCSLLSLDIHPDYVCGESATWFIVPAIGFLLLGLYILKKKSWYKELDLLSEIQNGRLILKKNTHDLSVAILEKEKDIEVIISSNKEEIVLRVYKSLASSKLLYSELTHSEAKICIVFPKTESMEETTKSLFKELNSI